MAAATKFNILLASQMICQCVVELVILETTYSLSEQTYVNIFFPGKLNEIKECGFQIIIDR
jgi:hypothetical protein